MQQELLLLLLLLAPCCLWLSRALNKAGERESDDTPRDGAGIHFSIYTAKKLSFFVVVTFSCLLLLPSLDSASHSIDIESGLDVGEKNEWGVGGGYE